MRASTKTNKHLSLPSNLNSSKISQQPTATHYHPQIIQINPPEYKKIAQRPTTTQEQSLIIYNHQLLPRKTLTTTQTLSNYPWRATAAQKNLPATQEHLLPSSNHPHWPTNIMTMKKKKNNNLLPPTNQPKQPITTSTNPVTSSNFPRTSSNHLGWATTIHKKAQQPKTT